ncbi:MAG: sensor histidine kinase [Paracoccaceae bacterium]
MIGALQDVRSLRAGLATQVVVLLALALVPVAVFAFWLTEDARESTQARMRLSLEALTQTAASEQRRAVQQAFGAASALSSAIDNLSADPAECSAFLRDFVARDPKYRFVGLVPLDGVITCASSGVGVDLSSGENFADSMANPRPQVTFSGRGAVSSEEVVIVSVPMFDGGADSGAPRTFRGYVGVSLPLELVDPPRPLQPVGDVELYALATFNDDGEVVTARGAAPDVAQRLQPPLDLSQVAQEDPAFLMDRTLDGRPVLVVAVPIVGDTLHALGVWDGSGRRGATGSSALLPALMWFATLIVVYVAVHRIVLRHVRRLRALMRGFMTNRRVPTLAPASNAPEEFAEMEEDFLALAEGVMRDEAQLEDNLRERGILLKEVHHRVKNNLQLISSVMSMKMRRSREPGVRRIVGRLQNRVLSLAAIHRNLYQSEDMRHVDAGRLVREIVAQHTGRGRVETRVDVIAMTLLPDQAVPLSLLAAEVLTNARQNLAPPRDGGPPWIAVTLAAEATGDIRLTIANSTDPEAPGGGEAADDGVGEGLIAAFVAQLGGTSEVTRQDGTYRFDAVFPISDAYHEPKDY